LTIATRLQPACFDKAGYRQPLVVQYKNNFSAV